MRISDWSSDVCSSDLFASHNARLLNAVKSRLTETEKKIVDARRHNIRVASLAYISLQEKALGVDLRQKRDLEIGRASCRERGVSVRVVLGGRRIIKKKKNKKHKKNT